MAYDFDYGTLTWVKSEIDETLKQAHSALETFVDDPEDETKLRFCINYLHQVRGTLQMVELYGAALVAEEMEHLAQAIVDGKVVHKDDAYEALMRGMLQLPDYLDKVEAGQHDMPVVLMPLLNDLRAARGEALLSENAFFSPDLTVVTPTADASVASQESEPHEELGRLARKLRHIYHLGLLGWFRDQNLEASLQKIDDVIGKLRQVARGQESGQMLWAAGGVVEGLLDGGLDSSVAVKLLLGQVDRQVKRVIDRGETALSDQPPRELTKNLLFYVAQSNSTGETVSELKSAFHLDELLPDAKELDRARESLSGPNTSLLQTVSKAILDDLARVKDNLDIFVRSEQRGVDGLRPLVDSLTRMADTLAMLGLGVQRKSIQEQAGVLGEMISGERAIDEDTLMDVAGALLSVEGAVADIGHVRAANDEAEEGAKGVSTDGIASEEIRVTDPEYHQVVQLAIKEAKAELARIKDAIGSYGNSPGDSELISAVPQYLAGIRGSLAMLNLERAAELVDACTEYVSTELLEKQTVPEAASLDTLADAITSIEYYLESIAERWGHPSAILEFAEQSLEALERSRVDGSVGAAKASVDELKRNQPESTSDPASLSLDATHIMSIEPQPGSEAVPLASVSSQNTATDRLDDALDMWLLDPTDTGAIDLLRRVVEEAASDVQGADIAATDAVAKLTQVIERVVSGEQAVDDATVAELYGARDAIMAALEETGSAASSGSDSETDGSMLVDFPMPSSEPPDESPFSLHLEPLEGTGDETPEISIDLPVEGAEDELLWNTTQDPLVFGVDSDSGLELELESETGASPEPEPVGSSAATVDGEIDDEIVDIFLEEAQDEVDNIARLLPAWQAEPDNERPLKDLRRSYHTLKGSGRLVGAADVGEFAWAFENMLNRVIDHGVQAGPAMFELLERARLTLPHLLELFKSGAKPDQGVLALMDQANALSRGEEIDLAAATAPFEAEFETAPSMELNEPKLPELPDVGEFNSGYERPDDVGVETFEVVAPDELQVEPEEPAIDPVLFDIYQKEAEGHLENLRRFVAYCRAGGASCVADENLIRPLHTLHGSSRTADIQPVAELAGRLERYTRLLQEKAQPVGEEAIDALADAIDQIEQTIPLLVESGSTLPDNSDLLARVDRLQTKLALSDQIDNEVEQAPMFEAQPAVWQLDSESGTPDGSDDDMPIEPTPESWAAPAAAELAEVGSTDSASDHDEDLLEIFLEEGTEILDTSDDTLQQWIRAPNNPELVTTMQRELHTLKGGARMAGIEEIGDLSHKVESLLTAVADGHVDVSKRMFDLLQLAQDRLVRMLEDVREHRSVTPATDLIIAIEDLLPGGGSGTDPSSEVRIVAPEGVEEVLDVPAPSAAVSLSETVRPSVAHSERDSSGDESPSALKTSQPFLAPDSEVGAAAGALRDEPQGAGISEPVLPPLGRPEEDDASRDRRKGSRIQHEQVRVRADLLDNLVNFAGEVSIYRSRLEQQVNSFRFNLTELDDTVARLREQLRQFEIETEAQIQHRYEEAGTRGYEDFDPLEFDRFTHMQQLSRSMLESLSDLDSLKGLLNNLTRESETLLLQQSRVNTDLQEGLMRSRMVPFAGQAPRLRRIVRQVCHELGKEADLQLSGAENEIDRTVLDRVMAPLEHMLRNAVAHGIESPQQRRAARKPPAGTISVAITREGSEIVMRISDDGAGIDIDAIRRRAISRGRITPDSQLTDEALMDLILESGFSTAEQITQIAGRGIGMDVVNSEIKQLGGTLIIDTDKGQGTRFTVRLPLTLSVARALLVNVGEETFAVPLLSVEGIERISHDELTTLLNDDKAVYDWLGQEYAFLHLGSMMGLGKPVPPEGGRKVPLLLTRSGDHRAALYVDGLIGSREVVVKSVGPQLSTLHGVSGATIMGDGTIILILDLSMLVRHAITRDDQAVIDVTAEPEIVEEHVPTIMVVDDSITVRKVTARLLERNNMNVVTAKDGVDALALLQEQVPDLMLLDIEMPRMDGFELATNMRNDVRLEDIPIIMITSRTGAKHRDRAMNIGVNKYMGKPFQESELLNSIQDLLAE